MARLLVVDDEALLARSLARSLEKAGHEVDVAGDARGALAAVESGRPDLVLLDIRLGDDDGLDVLRAARAADPDLVVIVMTAYGAVESAVEAMKLGARDYLRKPIDHDELRILVAQALDERRVRQRLDYYRAREASAVGGIELIAGSAAMREAMTTVERLAGLDLPRAADRPPVLLLGETGAGKDLVARLLHGRSPLAAGPFVDVNCASLPEPLVEAELFGYEKGAFTDARAAKPGLFETAEGGTLFLNEIGELPEALQAKLLSVLEQRAVRRVGGLRARPVDVWIIAATNRDLPAAARAGRFRQDLLYRLNLVTVELPPLRARPEDVPPLAEHFAARAARKYRLPSPRITPDALAALGAYPWPGNVRELAHVVERAVLLSHGEPIDRGALALPATPVRVTVQAGGDVEVELPAGGIDLERVERRILERTLEISGGNVSAAARLLGIGREALRYRMQKFGLGGTKPEVD